MTSGSNTTDTLILVEKEDGAERFKIRSDQLEHIGEKLRGFSVFNSIILPLIVSAATVFFTGLFQYISWANSVRLQEATELATRAKKSSEEITAAIGRRHYATYTFMAALRGLHARTAAPLATTAAIPVETTGFSANKPVVTDDADEQDALTKLEVDLNEERFKAYYDQLRQWNETIDQLLTEVDYALDLPIFMHARGAPEGIHEGVAEFYRKMNEITCSNSLTSELLRFKLNTNSLKLRLIGVHYCFMQLNDTLRKHKRIPPNAITWDDKYHKGLEDKLTEIRTMANELRCYALQRVDYYERLKETSIISPYSLWMRVTHKEKANALSHFKETATRCSPLNRPI